MDLFKSLVWDTAVKALLNQVLFKAVPWLGWGPLGFIVTQIVVLITDRLYVVLKLAIDFQVIAFKNKELEREFSDEMVKLNLLANEVDVESEEFKNARAAAQDRLVQFVRFDV